MKDFTEENLREVGLICNTLHHQMVAGKFHMQQVERPPEKVEIRGQKLCMVCLSVCLYFFLLN